MVQTLRQDLLRNHNSGDRLDCDIIVLLHIDTENRIYGSCHRTFGVLHSDDVGIIFLGTAYHADTISDRKNHDLLYRNRNIVFRKYVNIRDECLIEVKSEHNDDIDVLRYSFHNGKKKST